MSEERFDLVVIGGGIHGVGVAQAAAADGYRVLLAEKNRIGSGTSSRSSKLIHGGLRYLESSQFHLVRESLRERSILLRNAPGLVKPVRFYIPVYEDTFRKPWQVRIGLSLYAILGGLGRFNRFRSIPRSRWPELDGLRTEKLRTVFRYWDAATDDRELTRAVAASAEKLGAQVEENLAFVHGAKQEAGYAVRLRSGREERTVHCSALVNAAGPWVNRVLRQVETSPPILPIDLVQGAHILIQGRPEQGIYYTEAPSDRRAVFIMPWKGHGLVGTTETVFQGDPEDVRPLQGEIDYLLAAVARYLPELDRTVLDSFAGLRVLIQDQTTIFGRTRETVLLPDDRGHPRLISVYGGKLTGYRAAACKVMRRLRGTLPPPKRKGDTARIPLE